MVQALIRVLEQLELRVRRRIPLVRSERLVLVPLVARMRVLVLGRRRLVLMRMVMDREGRPNTGTYHSSYTWLTARKVWKREIKRIRKM